MAFGLMTLPGALFAQVGNGRSLTPAFTTNEDAITEVAIDDFTAASGFTLSDPKAVFDAVLKRVPPRAMVYPTENYYYFRFVQGGIGYAGNIRLDVRDRDEGKLHFAYYREPRLWLPKSPATVADLGAQQGVSVEKLESLLYRVTSGGTSVLFALNDLSGVKLPADSLVGDEQYVGPVFDESGLRFFLVFNRRAKVFHYLLDETAAVADRFTGIATSDRLSIGVRTGFAFYTDHRANRKLLVGVFAENVRLNNYFDGPFDQLPDNFIIGDALRNAILVAEPKLAGEIGRLGHFRDGTRYLIAPYIDYLDLTDLTPIDRCAKRRVGQELAYAACFARKRVEAGQ